MVPVLPAQRKGHMPQYIHEMIVELQLNDDAYMHRYSLVSGNLNPSSGGYRFVTAFAEVEKYSKLQSDSMPDVNSTLRNITRRR